MLDLYKVVLSNVTYDPLLFKKELNKARRSLGEEDFKNLEDWLVQTFPDQLKLVEKQTN